MKRLIRGSMVVVGMATAGAAYAECAVSADQGASVRAINPAIQADADLIVSMSVMPKLMHLDYQAAAQRPYCDLGTISGDDDYELWGSDTAGRQRKALPVKKGQPIAVVLPVVDMMKAIDAAKAGKAAPTEGYMLATIGKSDLTGWRFYTAMPNVTVLKHDMAQALAGDGAPIFRNGADGKTALFVPKG
ncbi:hypothetical protein [Sphingomonas nostoxanthinifaciens]|uniref:hypothetical protein n=1 Tax=Sphingomonas nostoxanthinifaciens TaxID=2872652 RepID=UPI001CC21763|nr:hypothetical protein [Sphingomonas nostoxanthinifaciens]UAK25543.1 hypothetical protein K8P63_05110 [Sphingomonas nostoxanthinifaciens]